MAGFKFRRQQRIGSYIVDFICFDQGLIIELDGGQHSERKNYDERRTRWLRSEGYTVLRFWNNYALQNTREALETIYQALNSPSPQPSPPVGRGGKSSTR